MIWAVVVIVFFSLSHSKLPFYILPALPAVAWILALSSPARRPKMASERGDRHDRRRRRADCGSDAARRHREAARARCRSSQRIRRIMVAAGGLLVVGGALIRGVARSARRDDAHCARCRSSTSPRCRSCSSGAHVFDAYFSAEKAIDTFVGEGQSFPAEPPFYSVGMLDQSVPFYLRANPHAGRDTKASSPTASPPSPRSSSSR